MADRPKCGDVTPKEDTNPNEDKVNEWDGKRTKWMGTTKGRERCLVTNVVDKGEAMCGARQYKGCQDGDPAAVWIERSTTIGLDGRGVR